MLCPVNEITSKRKRIKKKLPEKKKKKVEKERKNRRQSKEQETNELGCHRIGIHGAHLD